MQSIRLLQPEQQEFADFVFFWESANIFVRDANLLILSKDAVRVKYIIQTRNNEACAK